MKYVIAMAAAPPKNTRRAAITLWPPPMTAPTAPETARSISDATVIAQGLKLLLLATAARIGTIAPSEKAPADASAALGWGAKYGQASGIQGKTYGIPTKDASIRRTLSIEEIKPFVDEFIEFAKANENFIFLVIEIGCGLAGLKPKEVAPLFKEAVNVDKIYLPARFWHKLSNLT